MNRQLKRMAAVTFIAFGMLPLTACAYTGGPLQGKVLDEETRKPIPNAIVVARWEGKVGGIGHSNTVCFHVETASTDATGTYRIPAWQKDSALGEKPSLLGGVTNQRVRVDAYKSGYGLPSQPSQIPEVVLLRSFRGTHEDRLEYLLRISSAVRCGSAGEKERNLIPLKSALYREARSIAATKEDENKVETLLFGLESLEFGNVEALNRMTERRKVKK